MNYDLLRQDFNQIMEQSLGELGKGELKPASPEDYEAGYDEYCRLKGIQDAINLLIPMPVLALDDGDGFPEYECPRCNAYADDYEIVCDKCGQRIDWSKSGL